MGFAAINAAAHQGRQSRARESLEAQEGRIANDYAIGLRLVEEGRRSEALVAFEGLLKEAVLHVGNRAASISAASASQLRYLVLKNLASLLAGDDASAPRALSLYAQALMLDDGNSAVWNHMGTLAAELGRWGVARMVFEHGLRRHPKHAVMSEKLVEVLVQLNDFKAVQPALDHIFAQDPGHPRALQLKLAATSAICGDAKHLASRFCKRTADPQVNSSVQAGALRFNIPDASWSALLSALATSLKTPKQPQDHHGCQLAQTVQLKLQFEQRQPAVSFDTGEEKIDNMDADPVAAAPQVQPEEAQQSLGVCRTLPLAMLNHDAESTAAAQYIEQSDRQQQEPEKLSQKSDKGSDDAGRAAPARVSRRLEARREGHTDVGEAAEVEEVNILAQLKPFLTNSPPRGKSMPRPAPDTVMTVQPLLAPNDLSPEAEERAVRAYVAANRETISLHAAGITLLCSISQQKYQAWSKDTKKQMLALASAIGPSWRPEGEAALTIAELYLDAAEAAAEGRIPPDTLQQESMERQVGSEAVLASGDKRSKSVPKRKAAEHFVVAKPLAQCEEYLGHYYMSRVQDSARSAESDMTREPEKQCARHLWALARIAEIRRDYWTAGKHYNACQKICAVLEERDPQPGSINLPYSPSAVMRPDGSHRRPVISSAAAQAKVDCLKSFQVMESATAHFENGRADLVVAELEPLLLDEAGVAGQGPLSKTNSTLQGLQVLQDAAVILKDATCELKCRLAALKRLLPRVQEYVDDLDTLSAPASGPPPAALEELQKPFKVIITEAMSDLADFVAARSKAGDLGTVAASIAQQQDLLQQVQWQAAVLIDRAFWSLCGSQAQSFGHTSRVLNSKTTARQATLLAACMGFCAMHQLQCASQPASLDSVASEERVLSTACSILAQRSIVDLQRGAFVRLALGRFSHALSALKGLTPDQEVNQAAKEDLFRMINSNLARCLQLLFGVTLPHRNTEWGAFDGELPADMNLQNADECLEVWQHLRPYAESLDKDSKTLSKLQGILGAIQKHFSSPPASVLDAWDPIKLLDTLPWDKADVYSSRNTDLMEQLLRVPAELADAVGNDDYVGIHGSLYRMLDILKPELVSALKFGEGLSLTEESAGLVKNVVSLAAYDLRYNPRSQASWDSIANTYTEAASDIANEAARDLSVEEFHEKHDVKARFETYQRRALWASLVARQMAAEASMADDVPNLDEQIGNVLFEELANAPPLCDQFSKVLDPSTKRLLIQNAAKAYELASRGLPDEWLYACYSGKLQAKLGAAPERWLPSMARAVHLSVLHVGGMVEPFYQLHNQRLKMLLKRSPTLTESKTIARYCSTEAAAEGATAVLSSIASQEHIEESALSKVREILIADCMAAMRFCIECDKGYHKAAFQIARALAAQGRKEDAVQQLQGLFSGRSKFCISIWEIRGGSEAKSPRSSEAAGASEEDAMLADADDSLWGRQPGSMAGNGLDETFRKFAACRRKYMLLYLELLQVTGGFDMLLAGHTFLRSPVWESPSLMADLARIAFARCVVGAAAHMMQHKQRLATPNPQQPVQIMDQLWQVSFSLYAEHLLEPKAENTAVAICSVLPGTLQAEQNAVEWALKEGFRLAAQEYIAALGGQGQTNRLQELLVTLRKHYKALKVAAMAAQALAKLIAATLAHATDSSLTSLGAPSNIPRSRSASVTAFGDGCTMPTSSTAAPIHAEAPDVARVAFATQARASPASSAPSASSAPAASSAALAMPAFPANLAGDLLTLLRLGLSPAVATVLLPHMPHVLLQILPGNDAMKQMLQTSVLGGHYLGTFGGPKYGQQFVAMVQRAADSYMRTLSTMSGQTVRPVSIAASSAPAVPERHPLNALPIASYSAAAEQGMAIETSMREPAQQQQSGSGLHGYALAANSRAEPAVQPGIIVGAAGSFAPQTSNAASGQDESAAAARADISTGAAMSMAVQADMAPQQPSTIEEAIPQPGSPPAQDSQQMERAGEKRQEVFELMKLSRYLHRSGIAKLPALPNEAASITEGLAKIDSNMVKAYLLYMAITGAEVQAGSVITAADAATQCEELAKSLKQATPVKAARGSRDRPGLGAGAEVEGTEAGVGGHSDQDVSELPSKRRRREASRG